MRRSCMQDPHARPVNVRTLHSLFRLEGRHGGGLAPYGMGCCGRARECWRARFSLAAAGGGLGEWGEDACGAVGPHTAHRNRNCVGSRTLVLKENGHASRALHTCMPRLLCPLIVKRRNACMRQAARQATDAHVHWHHRPVLAGAKSARARGAEHAKVGCVQGRVALAAGSCNR